jgi:predicted acyltransferase
MLTGELLMTDRKQMKKVIWMSLAGILLMFLGRLWNLTFPINKNLWSSSFVCWVGGLSLLLLAIFYLIIDVWKQRKWAFFFVVIGMNPITIYLANRIITWDNGNRFFFCGIAALFPENWGELVLAIGYVTIGWLFLYFLYKKKIFLKV